LCKSTTKKIGYTKDALVNSSYTYGKRRDMQNYKSRQNETVS